ncbi:hypothetical protein O9G_004099 [Rozella allomycis CSF55]|uniref:Uncharacterized protein n=1 Tax=Rozella allomycis (strain CSF55) TaxID=988480 RepID=A0A075ARF5_ROZAC|nr:hypothetical protein O9G_004099 [Rozella allomycis CSF55]|eukprot:EPZ32828.1 hypothetical protein O9G_004099 [Rozella allomycis CSF55]
MKSLVFFCILLISIVCFDIKQHIREDNVEKVRQIVDNASYYEKRRYLTSEILSSCFSNSNEAKMKIFNYLLESVDKVGKLDKVLIENNFRILYDLNNRILMDKEPTGLCQISSTLTSRFASSRDVQQALSQYVLRVAKRDLSVDTVGILVLPIIKSVQKCYQANIGMKLVEENWLLMIQNIIEEEKNSEFVYSMIEFVVLTKKENELFDEEFAITLIESRHRSFYILHFLKIVEYFSLEKSFGALLGVPELRKAVEEEKFEEFDKIQRLLKRIGIEKQIASFDNFILAREASKKNNLDFLKILLEWDYVNSLASEKYEIIKNAFEDKRLLNYICENPSLPTVIMKSQISKENKVFRFLLENCKVDDIALGNIMDLIIKNNDLAIYEIFKSVEVGKRFINENFHTYILMSASKEKLMFFYDLFIIKMHFSFTIVESDFQISLNNAILKSDDPISLLGIVSKFYGLKIYPIFFNYDDYNLVYSHILTSEGDSLLKSWFINVICQKEESINHFIFSVDSKKAAILHQFMVDQQYYKDNNKFPLYVRILFMDKKGFEYLFDKDQIFFLEFYQSTYKNHLDDAMNSITKLRNEDNVYVWVKEYSRDFKNHLSYHTLKAFAEISSQIHNDDDFNSQMADILQSHLGFINQGVKCIVEPFKQETPTEENSSYYPEVAQGFKIGPKLKRQLLIDHEIKYLTNAFKDPSSFWRHLNHLNVIYSGFIVVDELLYFIKYRDFIKGEYLASWIERLFEVYPQLKSEIAKSKNFLSLLESDDISIVLNHIYVHIITDFYEFFTSVNNCDDSARLYSDWVSIFRAYPIKLRLNSGFGSMINLELFADVISLRYRMFFPCSQGDDKEFLTFTISRMRAALFVSEYEFSKFNLIRAIEKIENSLSSINLKFHPFLKRALNLVNEDDFSSKMFILLKLEYLQKIDQNVIEPKVDSIIYGCAYYFDVAFRYNIRDFTIFDKSYPLREFKKSVERFFFEYMCGGRFHDAIFAVIRTPGALSRFFQQWLPEA